MDPNHLSCCMVIDVNFLAQGSKYYKQLKTRLKTLLIYRAYKTIQNPYLFKICHADICVALFLYNSKLPTWLTSVCNSSGREDVSSMASKGGNWCSRSRDFGVYEAALHIAVRRTPLVVLVSFFRAPGIKLFYS